MHRNSPCSTATIIINDSPCEIDTIQINLFINF